MVNPIDIYGGWGTASGTNATGFLIGQTAARMKVVIDSNGECSVAVPSYRVSLSGSQTLYLKARVNCDSGTGAAHGQITAVRIR
jgi:hypothetical protein